MPPGPRDSQHSGQWSNTVIVHLPQETEEGLISMFEASLKLGHPWVGAEICIYATGRLWRSSMFDVSGRRPLRALFIYMRSLELEPKFGCLS